MTNNNDIIILLTATIVPNTNTTLTIKDSKLRLNQYLEALNFYVENTKFRIVFVENSNYNINTEILKNDRIEYITYCENEEIPDRGKGYKESKIIDIALEKSKFIKEASYIIKITGRLKVLNINKLFKYSKIANNKIVMCNIYKLGKMDSRCFLFYKSFWSSFKRYQSKLNSNNSYSFERALWNSAKDFNSLGVLNYYKQLDKALLIEGYSGGYGTPYHKGLFLEILKQIKHKIHYKRNLKLFLNS